MLDHVLRPISTAFIVCRVTGGGNVWVEFDIGSAFLVTRAKNAISALSGGQGRVPRKPRPYEGVVATINVKGGNIGISEVRGQHLVVGIFPCMEWSINLLSTRTMEAF